MAKGWWQVVDHTQQGAGAGLAFSSVTPTH